MTKNKKSTSNVATMVKKAWDNPVIKNAVTTFVIGIVTNAFKKKSKK